MSFYINAQGLRDLLSGKGVLVSDGIHPTATKVFLTQEAKAIFRGFPDLKSSEHCPHTPGHFCGECVTEQPCDPEQSDRRETTEPYLGKPEGSWTCGKGHWNGPNKTVCRCGLSINDDVPDKPYSRQQIDERLEAIQSMLADMESQVCQSILKDRSLFFYISSKLIDQLDSFRKRFLRG